MALIGALFFGGAAVVAAACLHFPLTFALSTACLACTLCYITGAIIGHANVLMGQLSHRWRTERERAIAGEIQDFRSSANK